ncbi:MAG: cohesin domain-containing protein [Methanosarcinaceae archaeon]
MTKIKNLLQLKIIVRLVLLLFILFTWLAEPVVAGSPVSNQPVQARASTPRQQIYPNSDEYVALFQDADSWNSRQTDHILDEYNISYDSFTSASMGNIDLTPFTKVILSSNQPLRFYDRLEINREWFEAYVAAGGILELHLASVDNLITNRPLPGGLQATEKFYNFVTILMPDHPTLNTPYEITEGLLNGWDYSIHGYFHELPEGTDVIIDEKYDRVPVAVELKFGSGIIYASMQAIEWNGGHRHYHENLVVYFPEIILVPEIEVTPQSFRYKLSPDSSHTGAMTIRNIGDAELQFNIEENSAPISPSPGDSTRDCPWLTKNPTEGIIAPGEIIEIDVFVDAVGMAAGNYNCDLVINSNDPNQSTVIVPVALEVTPCDSPYIQVGQATGFENDQIMVDIHLKGNPAPIDAFGMNFNFCADKLSFVAVQPGDLTAAFSFLNAIEFEPGSLTLGGFDSTAIPINSAGVLAQVVFQVNQCDTGETCLLEIQELVDDIAGLNICPGMFTCEPGCARGDVNEDGQITSGDALCAFEIYLYDGVPPSDECNGPCAQIAADANCDASITAGDALLIFEAYLYDLQPPLECPTVPLTKALRPHEIALSQQSAGPGEEIIFEIQLKNPQALQAFGLDLGYPDELLTFVEVIPAGLTENWQLIDGRENLTGVVTIGGFSPQAITTAATGSLVQVVFQVKENAQGCGDLWLFNPKDDLANASFITGKFVSQGNNTASPAIIDVPTDYALAQNFPNPFNLETEIAYQIPEAGYVKLSIYNSLGQKIQTLVSQNQPAGRYKALWNGRDDQNKVVTSGIYFYRLEAANFRAVRKLLLIK